MTSIEFVDLATAQAASGLRIVVPGFVPSPWSEALKGMLRVAAIPAKAVRDVRDNRAELKAWTGVDNVPIVLYDAEPVRTSWSAIVGLVSRLAGPDVLVPAAPAARAEIMGLLELIAGEEGLGWCGRLAMVDAALVDQRGFAPPIGAYLGKRYGAAATGAVDRDALRARVGAQLAILERRLGAGPYFGARVGALDVYCATFLTPLTELSETACPKLAPPIRAGFETARALLADLVPPPLLAHRMRVLEQHAGWPIVL